MPFCVFFVDGVVADHHVSTFVLGLGQLTEERKTCCAMRVYVSS